MNTAASDLPRDSSERATTPLRFVTAASLFDGHDAAINIMRRLIQAQGVEVIHLGHNRSVDDIVRAAVQEDADGIAVSSYQGGHNEFFRYMIDRLRDFGAGHIRVFGGGGGTITPEEIEALMEYGVERIYHPHDGMEMGLNAMIDDLIARTTAALTDELLNRFLASFPDMRIAVLAVDPTRRRTGGALLGDRIRMNSLRSERIYMRSIATRRQHLATSEMLADHIACLKSCGFDLVIVETAGIGQSDSEIVDLVDYSVYVMTSDYGAASQLEKIDMLDFADLVVLNKFDKRGAEDALRDIRKQWKRNRLQFDMPDDDVPVYPTIASQFNDPGVSWMFAELCRRVAEKADLDAERWTPDIDTSMREPRATALIPGQRVRYLAEIAEQGRKINAGIDKQAEIASRAQHVYESLRLLDDPHLPAALDPFASDALAEDGDRSLAVLRQRYQEAIGDLTPESLALLREWPLRRDGVRSAEYSYTVRGREIKGNNYRESLSHQKIPKIAAPDYSDWGELLSFLHRENLPGGYPYTGGVYPYRR
ncbi:MAG: cobalamin-dependent protein, partial [Woeseiaceae bacterium]